MDNATDTEVSEGIGRCWITLLVFLKWALIASLRSGCADPGVRISMLISICDP